MLTLRHLHLHRGGRPLLEDVSLTVHGGWKVGVVGANGSGKSSLLALLTGELHPDAGDLDLPPRLTIATVAQETPPVAAPAIDHVLDGDRELRAIEAAMAQAEAAADGLRLAHLHSRFDAAQGYTARARAGQLLAGLGFAPADLERPVAEFSGGWRMRLNLAQALMCRADLLLLDEPTNHLDLEAVLWVEQWLRAFAGTLLLISHDRDFLDNVVDHVAHLENRQIRLYAGNYSAFEAQRAARLAGEQAAYEKQQRETARLRQFIDRFRAKASKARQVQSRLRALARMDVAAAAHVDSPFAFAFRPPEKLPDPLLSLDKAAAGYAGRAVLRDVEWVLGSQTRLGLLGPNGAGKSTFVKLLAGRLPALAGRRVEGPGLKVGYFAQQQLEQLRPDAGPLQHLAALDPQAREQELRDFLGGFGFGGDAVLAPAAALSGGEKSRLCLALLVWQRPNLLLLDEPTNHLDLNVRHALTVALQGYAGALVVVSHDRHLLRTTVDSFALVADGRVSPFAGDLEDYRDWVQERQRRTGVREAEASGAAARREQRLRQAQQRSTMQSRRRPLEKRIAAVEAAMETHNAEKARLEAALADAGLYADARKAELKELLLRQAQLARELAAAEEEWFDLHAALEALEQAG
ncbi:MAG: ATP-binding cassette domain-containing protein [Pseudomonadota bacterium]|nr:ATP-binding cassette domain-containing protein [Pseudomonadota bacterium]